MPVPLDETHVFVLAIGWKYARTAETLVTGMAAIELMQRSTTQKNGSLRLKRMFANNRVSWKLVLGLLGAVAFDTILQITWKTTVLETPADASALNTLGFVFANPLFIAIIVIMALQFFNWLMVLAEADLSYAKPIASLSYASVPVLSVAILNEPFDVVQMAGVVFVLFGVWFISRTDPLTEKVPKLP